MPLKTDQFTAKDLNEKMSMQYDNIFVLHLNTSTLYFDSFNDIMIYFLYRDIDLVFKVIHYVSDHLPIK